MEKIIIILMAFMLLCSCRHNQQAPPVDQPVSNEINLVERRDTLGLIVLYPKYSTVDLVCGTMPSKTDESVILVAEAAFTGELLKEFKHINVAGDHVSAGERHKGFRCKRNTGSFVYYNGTWKFCYKDYSKDMDIAAHNGGCAFAQEMMIHNGKLVETTRKDSNKNKFRALCEHQGKLCVVESSDVVSFGDFKQNLMALGVNEALYLDMGPGWNYAWYRNLEKVVELHPKTHNYCTNWITFYK